METRPRRSHHRPLQGKLDTRSLPLPKQLPPTIAAALQSGPGRVWTPVLVRDQPWLYDSTSRSHLSSSCLGFFGFLVFGLSPVPGLAFSGVSAPCARVCVCVCVCGVPCLGLRGPFCVSAVLVLLWRPLRGLASRVRLFGVLLGSVFWSCFLVVFARLSQDTLGVGRVRDSSVSFRKSSKLRARQTSRAKVGRTHFPR